MRNNKNNITLSSQNIILLLNNLIGHLTDNKKIITLCSRNLILCFIILTLSLLNIILCLSSSYSNPVSALSYEAKTGVSFTINPSLSLSISSSDLVIDDLTPGTTADSNDITISIVTNAAYGYTLSATTSNNNLVRSDSVGSVFNSIATDTNLETLTTDNTWGYSYKNNLAPSPTWSNYSGLSTNTNKVLFSTDHNTNNTIDFKIAAKASPAQPSGIYTNTINFTAVSKPMPKTIEDIAYMQTFGELNPTDLESVKNSMVLNQDYILKDSRDEKEYYVTRLEDGNVWMTQNLDLDLDSNKTYTHYDTDLGWTTDDTTATWQPSVSIANWQNSNTEPYYIDLGNTYYYTSNSTANDIFYNSFQECITAGHSDCMHYHAGNRYNWPASVANSLSGSNAPNSICSSGWRLPNSGTMEWGHLVESYNIVKTGTIHYSNNGFNILRSSPLYINRTNGQFGAYRSSKNAGNATTSMYFTSGYIYTEGGSIKSEGQNIRCLVR